MHHYIVIEGPLGVGKTSLARMLAERMGAQTLLEDVEENPFLTKFYQSPRKHGFQTQMFFLLRRYHLALEMGQMGLFQRTTISDFLFDKDQIFARVNLEESELWLYEQLYQILKKRVTPPDLVIFLQARTEVLMHRIKRRNKKYEKNIGYRYLESVNEAFNEFFFHYTECPLLVVNASEIDFVHVPEDFEDLVERIGSMKSGVQYYIPMGSKKG
ncbi:MAG: deoxynucleoside kinase [Deltaproteobacteria bacterium]|nr:deoxynucleoside kinase [Deltaproteobacteria bacterium]